MDKKEIRYFIILFVCSIILWPLLDYCTTLITNEVFEYSVYEHVLEPVIFSFLITLIFMFGLNNKCNDIKINKKNSKK